MTSSWPASDATDVKNELGNFGLARLPSRG
jgi:hypothetical protein